MLVNDVRKSVLWPVGLFVLLFLPVSSLLSHAGEPGDEGPSFSVRDLSFTGRSTGVFTVKVNGDEQPAIVVIHREKTEFRPDKFLSVFRPGSSGRYPKKATQKIAVDRSISAVCSGDYHKREGDELLLIGTDGVYRLLWHSEKDRYIREEKRYLESSVFFRVPDENKLLHWPHAVDLNNSNRSDLILPTQDGYNVYFQNEERELNDKQQVKLSGDHSAASPEGISPDLFSYTTSLPNLLVTDFNNDGEKDIVCSFDERVRYYLQDAKTGFSSLPTGVFPLKHLKEDIKKNEIRFTAVQLTDFNQDGFPDIVVARISGKFGVFKTIKTGIFIYYGRESEPYPWTPDQIVRIPGISIIPRFQDANGDGYPDIMITALRTDLLSAAWNKMKGSLDVSHYLYLFNPDTGYLGMKASGGTKVSPDFQETVSVESDFVERGYSHRPRLSMEGDYNGDGKPDMFRMGEDNVLKLFPSRESEDQGSIQVASDPMFKKEVESPEEVVQRDLNGDGYTDVLLRQKDKLNLIMSSEKSPEKGNDK